MTKGHDHVDSEARQRLIDAALVIIDRDGVDGARLRDIVAEAGLTTGSLYWFFKNRRMLVNAALAHRYIDRMQRVLKQAESVLEAHPGAIDPLDLAMLEAAQPTNPERVQARRERIQVLAAALDDEVLASQLAEVTRTFTRQLEDAIRDNQAKGRIRSDIDPTALAVLVQSTAVGYAITDIADDIAPDVDQWVALNRIVIDAFRAPS